MTVPEIERRIETTAWSTIALGVVCELLAAVQALVPIVLRRVAETLPVADDPTRGLREAWLSGAGVSSAVNALFGVGLIVAGAAVVRRARWAHRAIEVTAWSSMVALLGLAAPTAAPFLAVLPTPAMRAILWVSIAALGVLQALLVVLFLRFWRRSEVRAVFR